MYPTCLPGITVRPRVQGKAGGGTFDFVDCGDVAKGVGPGLAQTFKIVKLAQMNALIDKQIAMHWDSGPRPRTGAAG